MSVYGAYAGKERTAGNDRLPLLCVMQGIFASTLTTTCPTR